MVTRIASFDSHSLDLPAGFGVSHNYSRGPIRSNSAGEANRARHFDGDPFPVQNQTPDGEPTLHDRALAMMRVLVVNMDRLHLDPTSSLFVDDVALANANVARGSTLSTDVAAYALLSLRTARRALDSELTLYSNTKPDSEGVPSSLDAFPLASGTTFGARLDQLIDSLSNVFDDELTTSDGRAFSGWNVAQGTPTDDGTALDAHTAAVRGLLVAYLATGQSRFRERAQTVFDRIESQFYDPSARVYRAIAGDRSLQVTFTPRRYGLIEGSLRDMYELVALLPGNQAMAALIEDRVARLNKIVLNGWDDRDQDEVVEWPSECRHGLSVRGGLPLRWGLGEDGRGVLLQSPVRKPTPPRRSTITVTTTASGDCVPEVSAVGLPAALADSITFTLTPWSIANEGAVQ